MSPRWSEQVVVDEEETGEGKTARRLNLHKLETSAKKSHEKRANKTTLKMLG